MKRIGFLGVDTLTESLVKLLFKAVPDTQIFISPGSGEPAQKLAKEYPCWTQDSHQAVVDEAGIFFINIDRHALNRLSSGIKLAPGKTLISLVPGVQIRELQEMFNHANCVRFLFVNVNDSSKAVVILTAATAQITDLFSLLGSVSVLSRESDFNMIEKNLL